MALCGVSLLKNGRKRQRDGVASAKSLGGTGGGSSIRPLCFVGEGGSENIPGVGEEAIRGRGDPFDIGGKGDGAGGKGVMEGRTSFDLDFRTCREWRGATSVIPCGSLTVGDGTLAMGVAFGGGCGASVELVEPIDP